MTRSTKLGVASLVLCAVCLTPEHYTLDGVLTAVALVLAIVLALLAARDGSKWWLAVPGFLVATVGVILALTWNTR